MSVEVAVIEIKIVTYFGFGCQKYFCFGFKAFSGFKFCSPFLILYIKISYIVFYKQYIDNPISYHYHSLTRWKRLELNFVFPQLHILTCNSYEMKICWYPKKRPLSNGLSYKFMIDRFKFLDTCPNFFFSNHNFYARQSNRPFQL